MHKLHIKYTKWAPSEPYTYKIQEMNDVPKCYA